MAGLTVFFVSCPQGTFGEVAWRFPDFEKARVGPRGHGEGLGQRSQAARDDVYFVCVERERFAM